MSLAAPQQILSRGRWLLALVEGDSLREAGLGLGLGPDGSVRFDARGSLDAVRLAGQPPLPQKVDVITLHGTIHQRQIRMRLAGVTPDGQMVAGQLDDARAVELELEIEAYDLAPLVPGPSVPSPSPSPSPTPSWAD